MSSIKKHKPRQTINGSVKTSSAVYGELTDNNKNRVLRDYNQLYNKPSIEGVILIGDKVLEDFGITRVLYNTKEGWNEETTLVGEEHTLYVYTDYDTDSDGNNIAGIKLGDGDSLLMNSPFLDSNSLKYKGTLGTNGDITTLPPASADNKHFVYSVITDNTYDSKPAVVDDLFWSDGSAWHIIKTHDTQYGDATPSSDGLMSATDKAKLNDIESGAEVNQNAFSNVKVGNTTVVADSKMDTLELTEGNGITLTPDTLSDSVSIAHGDTSNQESVENSGRTYVQSLVVDDFGHVLGISSATETVVNTDENVTQTPTTDNDRFPVLLSGTNDYSEHTEGVKKSSSMLFNPSAKSLNIGELHVLSAVPSIIITQKTGGGGGRPFEYKTIFIQGGDISLLEGGTWDGANSSLIDAVTSAKSTVTQEQTDDSAWDYELLFGHTSDIPYDDNDRTEATRKSKYLRFNPYDKSLVIGDEATHNSGSSVVINEALSNDTYQGLMATSDDISLTGVGTNTWDGTNRSLKNTIAGIYTAIDNLPDPMVFKGTVGAAADNPTVTSLPIDGTATVGDTYKCITDGTYGGKVAKVGDTLVCLTKTVSANTWELIPSGDETSGTVTNVATGVGLTTSDGQPITSTGTVKAKLKSETASVLEAGTRTNVTNREYPVGVDANGDLSVNVPWQGGAGLEYFEETEDALFGYADIQRLIDDPEYKITGETTATMQQYRNGELLGKNFSVTISNTAAIMMYYPYTYGSKSRFICQTVSGGGFLENDGAILVCSKNTANVGVTIVVTGGNTRTSAFNMQDVPLNSSDWYHISGGLAGYGAYAWRTSTVIDGDTWYGMFIMDDVLTVENRSNYKSTLDYISVSDYPEGHNDPTTGKQIAYDTLEEAVRAVLLAQNEIIGGNFNGISREGKLAFFAGADDEHGTNAPIKIYRDGTYEGLDKVEDVQIDGTSAVTNKIANINTMVGATSSSNGTKGLVPRPTSANYQKFLRGDGTWANPSGSADMQGATASANGVHGLVPAPLIANRDQFLKGDGTWSTPQDTTYDDFNGSAHGLVPAPGSGDSGYLKVDGTWDEPEGTTVIANPTGTATNDLTKLQVGEDVYNIPSGGTTVVANPIQPALAALTKLQVESTIYSIPSGGGASDLADLGDVDIITPTDGQILKYDNSTSKWINVNGGGSGTGMDISEYNNWYHISITNTLTDLVSGEYIELDIDEEISGTITLTKSGYSADVSYSEWITQGMIVYGFVGNDIYTIEGIMGTIQEYRGSLIINYRIKNTSGYYVSKVDIGTRWSVPKSGWSTSALDDLTDVDITSPSNNDVLKYNSSTQKWENGAGGGGGGSTVTITPRYNRGTEIATFTIDGVTGKIYLPVSPLTYTNSTNVQAPVYDPDAETIGFVITPGNGYEGITFRIPDLEASTTYTVSFTFRNNVSSFGNYAWRCELNQTQISNYNVTKGTDNLPKTTTPMNVTLTETTTATGELYLVFYLPAALGTGAETISNLVIEEVV